MSKWEELEKAARAATPGPWGHEEIDPTDPEWGASEVFTEGSDNYVATHVCSVKDAAYIAAANPSAILELLAERDALNVENERLTNCLKKANDQAEDFERRWYLADMELDRIRAMEPVAWISEDQTVGPTYGKKRYDSVPIQSLNPMRYKHTPLYTLEKP